MIIYDKLNLIFFQELCKYKFKRKEYIYNIPIINSIKRFFYK